ncbi:hypothetical protein [Sphingomonas faeni]|uniref:hypothetical protein n=1 Tax=Sphingomonas faeni TaxID=185950 RepID=UPI0027D89BC3|nr:hypothetical protein [Sphingomonas faeni]
MGLGGAIDWGDLIEARRALIVSAAGAGKTHECREHARKLFADGKAAFFLTLEGISTNDLRFLLEPVQYARYQQWLSDGHSEAHFFLDSADELLLSHGDFRLALRKLAYAIDGQLHRARIIVTSRPIALDLDAFASELPVTQPPPETEPVDSPDETFRRLIGGEARKEHHASTREPKDGDRDPETGVRIFGLTSLSQPQIEWIAGSRGVKDVPALVAEIARKRAWEFARRPQELIEICAFWNEHGRLGTRSQQIAEDVRRKLQETGYRKRHVTLSDAKALEGAERLALAQILTRKRTIRFSDLSLDAAEQEAALDPSVILPDWPERERGELLQRPLFGFASYGRVRFHHRSAVEFLAAQRLNRFSRTNHMARSALFGLLFGECYGQQLIFPSMRAVAAWLAIGNDAVRDEVLRREPEALMDDGDPEGFPISARCRILVEYVRRYGRDEWRGVRIPYPQVLRFASPELSSTVRELWNEDSTSPEVRELLIDLVQAGRMQGCLDIAAEVANDPKATQTDRITALTALAEMTEPGGLDALVTSVLTEPHWPSGIKEGAIGSLFPKHMAIDRFVRMIGQIDVTRHSVGGIEWTLPRMIPGMRLGSDQTEEFRASLARLMEDSIERSDDWPYFVSRYRHLSPALATLCLIGLDGDAPPSRDLIAAAVVATRLRGNEYGDEKPGADLVRRFRQAPRGWRRDTYVAEGAFCAAHVPSRNGNEFGANLANGTLVGQFHDDDFDWLIAISSDGTIERKTRAAAFRDAMGLIRLNGTLDDDRVAALRNLTVSERRWTEELEKRLAPPMYDRTYEAQEAQWKADAGKRKAEERAAIETWVTWRNKVLSDPDAYFAETDDSRVVRDFAQVLEQAPEHRGWRAHWNRPIITTHFDDGVADRVRSAFCNFWRTVEVPLRSERAQVDRNTVWTNWVHALAGVYAEAENPDWAKDLVPEDAERAARLAPEEMNGVPPWLAQLVVHHPEVVDRTLGRELSAQLDDAITFVFPGLLADFSRADHGVLEFFAPRVKEWGLTTTASFDGEHEQARMYDHLERALDYLLRSSVEKSELLDLARRRLEADPCGPFVLLWLMLLLSTSPEDAIGTLERLVDPLDPQARYRLSVNLFATFSDRRSARFCPDLSDPRFTPPLLLRLLRLAYAEIRLVDDIERSGTGTYSPTSRDEAQHGRGAVLNALLACTGPEAWAVKQAMRADPLFAHFKDRLDQLSREKAATEAEGPASGDADIAHVEAHGEAPPADRNGMFQLMMDRLTELRHDIAAHEFSERPILVGINHEKNMQVWFARRLQERENGVYRVDREALVANDKETDIRLLSVRSDAQAVIEMKLANNGYSVADLETALDEQLVGQYMQHDDCRAGCLLVTMNKARRWQCSETATMMDFEAVISRLRAKAIQIERRMNHEVRLAVIGIDLSR